jgi:hypothetical protein
VNFSPFVGNRNDGTLEGAPRRLSDANCVHGGCLAFNGSNYVAVPSSASLSIRHALTIEVWVLPTETQPTESTSLVCKGYQTSYHGYELALIPQRKNSISDTGMFIIQSSLDMLTANKRDKSIVNMSQELEQVL